MSQHNLKKILDQIWFPFLKRFRPDREQVFQYKEPDLLAKELDFALGQGKDISEKDLWKIEAGLQLSKEKVADYGPINNLLMIKEGDLAGLSTSEIAAAMYGWSEKQVIADLERLNLIDLTEISL